MIYPNYCMTGKVRSEVYNANLISIIDLSKLGIMNSGNNEQLPIPSFVMYGDFWFMLVNTNAGQAFFVRIKENGQWCAYSYGGATLSLANDVMSNIGGSSVSYIGSNGLLISSNKTFFVQLPSYFSNESVIPMGNVNAFSIPPNPCGHVADTSVVGFDSVSNTVLVEYYNPFPDDYQLWAHVYKYGANGFVSLNGGYCGFFDNSINPLVLNNSVAFHLPPDTWNQQGVGTVVTKAGFNNPLCGKPLSYQNWNCVVSHSITYGVLNCSGAQSLPQLSINMKSALWVYDYPASLAAIHANETTFPDGCCSFPNVATFINAYSGADFFDGYRMITVYCAAQSSNLVAGGFCGETFFRIECNLSSHSIPTSIYCILSRMPSIPFVSPPSTGSLTANHLVNNSRPVSIIGAYKT